jgi:hypothetical protein
MRGCLRRGILGGDKAASSEHPRSPESFRDKERANAVPGQKNRRPQGFVAQAGLALLLLAYRPLRVCSLVAPRHAGLGTKTGTLGFLNQALKIKWRRERDSNPRKDCSFTGLANLRFRPLSHLSSPHYSNRSGQITQANSHAADQTRLLRRVGADRFQPDIPRLPRRQPPLSPLYATMVIWQNGASLTGSTHLMPPALHTGVETRPAGGDWQRQI